MTKLLVRVLLPLAAGGALLAGCTSTQGGTASPAQSSPVSEPGTSESQSSGGGGTQSITDACSLLEAGDVSSFGEFKEPVPGTTGDVRTCRFQQKVASASENAKVIGVNIRDTASVAQVNDTGGGVVDKDVNGRKAKEAPGGASVAACTLALPVGDSSRVDVAVTGAESADQACQVAEAVAKAVEPRLPKG
ncbi:Protein of unknown function [Amycolatopsis pretoriensis]|uniref:DUF3558 domain-containing protein n=1 Tax=Amycolatopsis pretoriensis TaxID=218821 RepID=A0A1H5QWX1_9PSEU|nr:DUF3558 family protein [Amycolatopsis pretoriensis]SEF30549.1 Protein of unknown function [Amycolatopsis pretoriensis]